MKLTIALLLGTSLIVLALAPIAAQEPDAVVLDGTGYLLTPDQADLNVGGNVFTITARVLITEALNSPFNPVEGPNALIVGKADAYAFYLSRSGGYWMVTTQLTPHSWFGCSGWRAVTPTFHTVRVVVDPTDNRITVGVDGRCCCETAGSQGFSDTTSTLRVGVGLVGRLDSLDIVQATDAASLTAQAVGCRADWDFAEAAPPYHDGCGADNALRPVRIYYFPIVWKG